MLLRQEIHGECLLQKRVAFVFFVPKYTGVDTMCAVGASVGANGCIVGASDFVMHLCDFLMHPF